MPPAGRSGDQSWCTINPLSGSVGIVPSDELLITSCQCHELVDRCGHADHAAGDRGRAGDVGGAADRLVARVPRRGDEHGAEVDDPLRRLRLERVQRPVVDAAGEGEHVDPVADVAVLVRVDGALVGGDEDVVGRVADVPDLVGVELRAAGRRPADRRPGR